MICGELVDRDARRPCGTRGTRGAVRRSPDCVRSAEEEEWRGRCE